MSANFFKVEGERVDTSEDFFSKVVDGEKIDKGIQGGQVKRVLFYGDSIVSTKNINLFEGTSFKRISFKGTLIKGFRFRGCIFNRCLFLSTKLVDCDFSDCTFIDCNFLGCELSGSSRLNPKTLKNNFNFKEDANIGVRFFQHLYDFYSDLHQPEYKRDAEYFFLKAKNGLTHFYYKEKRISKLKHYYNVASASVANFVSGYGVYKLRIVRTLLLYLLLVAVINYMFSMNFVLHNDQPLSFCDSLYFTFVTITTIGFGDIIPSNTYGQLMVIIESGFGIFLIAYTLNIFTGGDK